MTGLGAARSRRHEPVVITDIAGSRTAEIRSRERRYVIAMVFRAVCFVAATLLFHGPARWLAVAVAIMMPWLAVVLANAPARVKVSRQAAYEPPAPQEPLRLDPGREHIVIEPDEWTH